MYVYVGWEGMWVAGYGGFVGMCREVWVGIKFVGGCWVFVWVRVYGGVCAYNSEWGSPQRHVGVCGEVVGGLRESMGGCSICEGGFGGGCMGAPRTSSWASQDLPLPCNSPKPTCAVAPLRHHQQSTASAYPTPALYHLAVAHPATPRHAAGLGK